MTVPFLTLPIKTDHTSEPSLLSGINQSGGSKQAAFSHSLVSSSEAKESDSVRLRRLTNREENNKENSEPLEKITPRSSRSDPPSPVDPSHKPSYLKLSCAVSGYGKYSRYSTYKDVNRRSPFSSQSSLRSEVSSPEPGSMPAERKSGEEGTPEHHHSNHSSNHLSPAPLSPSHRGGGASSPQAVTNNHKSAVTPVAAVNGHSGHIKYPTGDIVKEPDPDEPETLWGDLQGFWDMVKIQIDNVDDLFAEIELMRHNGWQEIPKQMSRRSSASSSPKSGTISQASTPSATPGSKRKNIKPPGSGGSSKNTPDSSPERTQKARQAAKARDEARRKLLAERRAAMKQQLQQQQQAGGADCASVEIFVPDKK
ncbi:disks large-associated protein 1 [Elysia marginata]|uniref:Disks large-associated protein 1 n=1 Tax=Elysia marginata TaxID=1093978 RepID=A0AAV4I6Z2_9GAST|nr:disks large-associated protein 1 [Elysia marginata]